MNRVKRAAFVIVVVALAVGLFVPAASAAVNGSVFVVQADGTALIPGPYESKADVYLSARPPGKNTRAALPDGYYYFQVTDATGTVLYSEDAIANRSYRILGGAIVSASGHALGAGAYGSKTVQLAPFLSTADPTCRYTLWVTPVGSYSPGKGVFGFVPKYSKTAQFVVREPALIDVRKFMDLNWNGQWEQAFEPEIAWEVSYVDVATGLTNTITTPATVKARVPGDYVFTETRLPDWYQLALFVDGVDVYTDDYLPSGTVTVVGTPGETHTVVFGNITSMP